MRYENTIIKFTTLKIARKTSLITLIITLLLILPPISFVVSAADIIVDDDGTGDYTSIQDAINNALPGDTIWVKDGSYNEQLTISTSDIKIIADNGAEPILYLTSYSPGISINANNVIIEGLKIYGNANPGGGPVIQASSAADDIDIRSNTFVVITGEIGNTALLVQTGADNVQFSSNSIRNYHIGVELEPGSTTVITSNSNTNVDYTIYHGATVLGTNIWYGTVQDAIDIASSGNTVSVVAGQYEENLQINKSLQFVGAQTGNDPTSGRLGHETVINGDTSTAVTIVTGTSAVTIDGFTFTMPNKNPTANHAGIRIDPASNNIIIRNNIFENITDGGGADTTGDETYAVMVWGRDDVLGGQHNITIQKNLIRQVEEYGIAINDNTSYVTIKENRIMDLLASDHSSDPIWDPSWPEIICSAIHLGGQVGPIKNIIIEDNILMTEVMGDGTSTAAGSGVSLAGVDEWPPGVRIWNGFSNINIEDNVITNNSMGIISLVGYSNGSVICYDNDLSDNTQFGINNLVTNLHFEAVKNWWGNITGPFNLTDNPSGTGSSIYGNITFWPWYEFKKFSVPPFIDYVVGSPNVNFGEIIKSTTDISINANDNESGMLSLTYRIWNTTHRWGPWQDYLSSFKLTSEGNHRVQVNATDVAGTSTYIGPFSYYEHRVDNVAPTVELLYPNGEEFIFGNLPIEWLAYDGIFDQGQLDWNGHLSVTGDYPGHIQSFVPTENTINSVQLLLSGDDATLSVMLFSSIHPVPTVLAQSTKHLQNIGSETSPEWVDFPFSSSIALDTSETYYIGITQEIIGNTGFNWHYFENVSIDRYPYGHAWIKAVDSLINQSTMDFGFKTLYWNTDLDITIQYSITGVSPWSTIAEGEINDGIYTWNTATYGIPDGSDYRVRILAIDRISNIGFDQSDDKFTINNIGPAVYDITITDTTITSTEYTKNGDNLEITASINGDPIIIEADLSGFGKGPAVPPTSYTGGIARWIVSDIITANPDGPISLTIYVEDATGDSAMNSASITADNTHPTITITKPRPGLYFMDSKRLLPFSYPFIIGQITFETEVFDDGSGVELVEFYLEDTLESVVTEAPYRWVWNRQSTGFWDVEIVVTDRVGHSTSEEIKDLFIINLGIFT